MCSCRRCRRPRVEYAFEGDVDREAPVDGDGNGVRAEVEPAAVKVVVGGRTGLIKAGSQSATKIASFRVLQAVKPSLSIGDSSAAEGNAGTTMLSFPVTLSAAGT